MGKRRCSECNNIMTVVLLDESSISACYTELEELVQVRPDDEACENFEERWPEEDE